MPISKTKKISIMLLVGSCSIFILFLVFLLVKSFTETPVETVATIENIREEYQQSYRDGKPYTSSTTVADIVFEAEGKLYRHSVPLSSYPHTDSEMHIKYVKGNPAKIYVPYGPILAVIIFMIVWTSFMIIAIINDKELFSTHMSGE